MFHIVFFSPQIPPNTGNAIRLSAVTGCTLHLVEPLGFDLSDAKLRRAGLDYHDLAHVVVHPDFPSTIAHLRDRGCDRIYAFTGRGSTTFSEVSYERGDALLFGPEPDGLPEQVLQDPAVAALLRIPMRPGIRSLNLSNSAAIAVYEAWRQHGYHAAE
ncbi:MAG: tRNA (cytidine(34)-2'-O)-methyltransferase [Beutenbergiaceae bacterium]